MKINLLNFSIVVLGDRHNPTIINQDFLTIQNIIPKEWGWEVSADEIISIPPLAQVPYKNGTIIQVEPNKAQFTDQQVSEPKESKITEIAKKFVHTLKHVKYKAVGINYNCFFEIPNPENYLIEHFIKEGKWNSKKYSPEAVGIKFVYKLQDTKLTLQFDPGTAKHRDDLTAKDHEVVLIHSNFHKDCSEYPADDEIESYISDYYEEWGTLKTILEDFFNLKT